MRIKAIGQSGLLGGIALGVVLGGCNSFDEKPGPNANAPQLVIPVDERPATAATNAALPVSGGTLSVLSDSSAAILADPERDTVSIIDLNLRSLRQTVVLEKGDEPGRSVEDGDHHVHVALRSGGAVVTIDPLSGELLDRRAVCKAPRGIAFEAATSLLHVACAEGKLVSLSSRGGPPTRTLDLDTDLRDVMVRGSELWVTRFKSAEMLRVNSTGGLANRVIMPQIAGTLAQPLPPSNSADVFVGSIDKSVTEQPGTAWRAVPSALGGAIVVHQQAVIDDIEVAPAPTATGSTYGGGGGFSCSGIVTDVVSSVGADGSVMSMPFSGPPMPVDVAVSPAWVAVAHAGVSDPDAPRPKVVSPEQFGGGDVGEAGPAAFGPNGFSGTSSISVMPVPSPANGTVGGGCNFAQGVPFSEPVTAVAFAPNGTLLAQTREPARLLIMSAEEVPFGTPVIINLPGESRLDTGHELFHRDAGGGIACASCHPEGGEDGRTWHFTDTGARRTQALHVGLRDTAPFHWNGDLANVGTLMSTVFVGRMGGARQSSRRLSTLEQWLFSIEPPPAIRDAADPAALRGKDLFDSAAVGCTSCHSGAKLTNNQSVAIDTLDTKKLQVPSLVAIGYRAPFMHTGCAATLAARFNPACGGDAHGNTAGLSELERGDLVAYLETL